MILCDTNVWLALVLSKHTHHEAVQSWVASIEEPGSLLFCRATQQSLLRLLSNVAVLSPYGNPALSNRQAWGLYEQLLADDRILFHSLEPPGLEAQWKKWAVRGTASPKLWMDAYLAAFAKTGGLRLATTDGAFSQFAGLDVMLLGQD